MGPVGWYARAHAAVSQPVAAHPCGGHLDRGHAVPLARRRTGAAPGGLPAAPRRPVPEDGLALPSARLDLPRRPDPDGDRQRSEEHTSELQSPCNLVCRLLLEKKKRYDKSLESR